MTAKQYFNCSILIPTFKREQQLISTINQVVSQVLLPEKVIISDNDSISAESFQYIHSLLSGHSVKLEYYSQSSNLGVIGNLRFLLSLVTTEFFVIFSDDDWHSPFFLCHTFERMSSTTDFVCSDYSEVDCSGNVPPPYPLNHRRIFQCLVYGQRHLKSFIFYFLPAELGKQNMLYSLFRTSSIMPIVRDIFALNYRPNNLLYFDLLLSYSCISRRQGEFVDSLLFSLTVNNEKLYLPKSKSIVSLLNRKGLVPARVLLDLVLISGSKYGVFALFLALPFKLFSYIPFYAAWRLGLFHSFPAFKYD